MSQENIKSLANNCESKNSDPEIKEGVDFVFEQNPELEKNGNKKEYSEYLDKIFPESKVKDIVHHATYGINKFDIYELGTEKNPNLVGYFGKKSDDLLNKYGYGDKLISVLLNINNPYKTSNYNEIVSLSRYELDTYFLNEGYDSILFEDANKDDGRDEIGVFNSSQIYILGSEKDIEGFKKFIEDRKQGLDEKYLV